MTRKGRFDETHLSELGEDTLNVAVAAIEYVLGGSLMLMVFETSDGEHFSHFRPGSESVVAQWLATIDFKAVARQVEEHIA